MRVCALVATVLVFAAHAEAQQTVRYEPAEKDLKFVYATVPAVATLKPGDTLETRTFDAFGNVIRKRGDTMAIMAVGAYRPLDDALRIAFTELVGWIHSDYGLSEMDGYELLSKVAKIHLVEMVDPNYVVIAGIDKRYLPKK
jgi:acetamidase/formamidase